MPIRKWLMSNCLHDIGQNAVTETDNRCSFLVCPEFLE